MKFLQKLLFIAYPLILSSCMESIKPALPKNGNVSIVNTSNYSGCVAATGVSISSIQVQYAFPSDATEIIVYRDGINVMSSKNRLNTTFTDINLQEGGTYHYTCEAIIKGVVSAGTREVDGITLSVNAPVFSGIASVVQLSPTSAKITWAAPTGGAAVKSYKIYARMNDSVDFTLIPRAVINSGITYTTNITGLADDMPYKFAVRACNATDVCDSNTKEISTTMADNGAATTVGASGVSLYDGSAIISVPWTEPYGAVKKRRLYRSTTNDVNAILANLIRTVDVTVASNLNNPPVTIEDNTVVQGTTYYYIARDEDPSGNINTNTNIVSISTGDLTAPIFSGLTSIALDNPQETSVLLSFTAINSQPMDPTGASYYLLYKTESDPPASPDNSCSSPTATLIATLDANLYTPGANSTYKVTGLTSRKKYSFCLKAQDEALNISNTSSYREQVMPDLTAPQFDGLQNVSYNITNEQFTLVWNPSSSPDINHFKVKIWKNTTTPTLGQITNLTYNVATNPSSAIFGKSDFSFNDGDTVYMLVDACDNASPTFNTIDNCTEKPLSSAISKNLLDTSPPIGFLGIQSATATSQGIVKVDWSLPSDKSDYAGFKFYNIEEVSPGTYQKVFLGDTYCISNNCAANPKTSFNLSVSRDYHKYNLFMSAIDNYGNETNAVTAISSLTYFQVTTVDTTKPSFTSSLSVTLDSGNYLLSWSSATDNQYSKLDVSSNNILKYDVYRKTGTTLLDPGNYIDGLPNLAGDVTIERIANKISVTNFSDSTSGLAQGQTYSYTICAYDMSANYKCEGIRSVVLADNLAPVIDMAYTNPSTPNSASWDLKLKIKDGAKDATGVITYVYLKFSDNKTDFPSGSGALVAPALPGVGASGAEQVFTYYSESLSNSSNKHYANYLIKAVDAAGNITTREESIVIRKPTIAAATLGATITEDTFTTISSLTPGSPAPGLSSASLVYSIVTNAAHGTASNCRAVGATVSCDYNPAANYFGSDSFIYRVSDGVENSSTVVTVNLTVTNVNDVPVAGGLIRSFMVTCDGANLGTGCTPYNLDLSSVISDKDNGVQPAFSNTLTATYVPGTVTENSAMISCSGTSCAVSVANVLPTEGNLNYSRYGQVNFQYNVTDGEGGTSGNGLVKLKIWTPYTWTGKAGDGNFNNPANWCGSLNSSGDCGVAASAPSSSTNVVFSDLCTNCNVTIPSNVNVNAFHVMSNFPGKITLASGITLTAKDLLWWGGEVDATLAASISSTYVSTTHAIGGKNVFKAPALFTFNHGCGAGGGSMFLFAPDTASGGAFTHNNGKLKLNSSCTTTSGQLDNYNGHVHFGDNVHLYDLEVVSGSIGSTYALYNHASGCGTRKLFVDNNLTVVRGGLVYSSGATCTNGLRVNGNVNVTFTNSGDYGDIANINYTLTGSNSKINMGDTTKSAGKVIVDSSGHASTSAANLKVSSLTIKDGEFTAPTGTLEVSGDFTIDNSGGAIPVFYHNNGTVFLNDNTTTVRNLKNLSPSIYEFKNLNIKKGNNSTTVTGNFSVLENLNVTLDWLGTINSAAGANIDLYGNYTYVKSGQAANDTGLNVQLKGTNNQILSATGGDSTVQYNFNSLDLSTKTSGNVTFQTYAKVYNTFNGDYLAGLVSYGGTNFTVGGTLANTASIRGNGRDPFNNLNTRANCDVNVNILNDLAVDGNFSIGSTCWRGSNISGVGSIYLKGNFAIWGGTTPSSAGTNKIYFVGSGNQTVSTSADPHRGDLIVDKPGGVLTFSTGFGLSWLNLSILSGTVDFNGKAIRYSSVKTEPGTVVNSWSTLTYTTWTNNGGTQNP